MYIYSTDWYDILQYRGGGAVIGNLLRLTIESRKGTFIRIG